MLNDNQGASIHQRGSEKHAWLMIMRSKFRFAKWNEVIAESNMYRKIGGAC